MKNKLNKIARDTNISLKNFINKQNNSNLVPAMKYGLFSGGKKITVTGKINGFISNKIIGTRGFGYDPIFIPLSDSITFGQMSKLKKIRMDHRFIAFKKLKKKIKIL